MNFHTLVFARNHSMMMKPAIRDHQSEKVALESVAKIKSTNDQKVRRVYRY